MAKAIRNPRAVFRRLALIARASARQLKHAADDSISIWRERRGSNFGHGRNGVPDETGEPIELNTIAYKALVSLEQHQERRSSAQRQFAALGLDVEWKIPAKLEDVPWASVPRVYRDRPEKASHAVTLISVLDEVERAKVPSFMHFEDDVIFHSRISTLLPRLRVPRDWKFIYLGGRNFGTRIKVWPGLVRSDHVVDLHAVIVRSDMIPHLRKVLLDPTIDFIDLDHRFATLHRQYPAYLCRPNLAWQSPHSDDSGTKPAYCNYYAGGAVRIGQGD
ncbi:MAG: hypothetical protein ACRD3S_09210 [Terracidiphilus sp.]